MRNLYHDQMDQIVSDLVSMAEQVQQSVVDATRSLLTGHAPSADSVIAGDDAVDESRDRIEDQVFELMARQQPVAGDLRMLMAAVRMVADLERMGDLSVHVAKVTRLRSPDIAVPPELRPMMARMGEVAADMVGSVSRIIAERDVDAAILLEQEDEEMDELRRRSFLLMLGDDWQYGVEAAIDVALLGRYYERIADHAVSLARRVVYLVTGQLPTALNR